MRDAYRAGIVLMGAAFVLLGVAMTVVTVVRAGGFGAGYVLGPAFIALGAGRIYLALRRREN